VFRRLVLARIIEPASKVDSLRVLEETGVSAPSYRTLLRRLPVYAKDSCRQDLAAACAAHTGLGPATLVPYDVSALYSGTDSADGFRESGFSKERRLEPQITIGLLTDQAGFPPMISAFEGKKAEIRTMLPVIEAFMTAHQLPGVTVVADAGMISGGSQKAVEATGLSFILGMRIPLPAARRPPRQVPPATARRAHHRAAAGLFPGRPHGRPAENPLRDDPRGQNRHRDLREQPLPGGHRRRNHRRGAPHHHQRNHPLQSQRHR
jgi:hypothetical protein